VGNKQLHHDWSQNHALMILYHELLRHLYKHGFTDKSARNEAIRAGMVKRIPKWKNLTCHAVESRIRSSQWMTTIPESGFDTFLDILQKQDILFDWTRKELNTIRVIWLTQQDVETRDLNNLDHVNGLSAKVLKQMTQKMDLKIQAALPRRVSLKHIRKVRLALRWAWPDEMVNARKKNNPLRWTNQRKKKEKYELDMLPLMEQESYLELSYFLSSSLRRIKQVQPSVPIDLLQPFNDLCHHIQQLLKQVQQRQKSFKRQRKYIAHKLDEIKSDPVPLSA